jgi:hypothetical protein
MLDALVDGLSDDVVEPEPACVRALALSEMPLAAARTGHQQPGHQRPSSHALASLAPALPPPPLRT